MTTDNEVVEDLLALFTIFIMRIQFKNLYLLIMLLNTLIVHLYLKLTRKQKGVLLHIR